MWARVKTEYVNPSVAKVIITISLGTAQITSPLLGGLVCLGLKRVKLRLRTEGGKIPHEDRWPERDTETLIRVELTEVNRQQRGGVNKGQSGY